MASPVVTYGQPPKKKIRAKASAYPGERAAHDPWLEEIMAAAVKFWHDRNVNVPYGVRMDVADNLDDSDTRGEVYGRGYQTGDPLIVLDGDRVGRDLAVARNARHSTRIRRKALNHAAAAVFHEAGHVGGLQHTPYGLMSPDATPAWDAQRLVRRLIPRNPRVDRAQARRKIRGGLGSG